MLSGFLGKLTSSAIRGLARNLFPGFYERGLSANKALGELRELGLGYRRQDFLNDYRVGEQRYDQATKVKFVPGNATPSEGILENLYHGVPDKYSFVFKSSGIDENTGENTDQYFFYHRNSIDTRNQMEDDAQDWISSEASKYGFLAEGTTLVEGYINPVWA